MRKIAVFGSLRKGWWNHDRFGLGEPIEVGMVRGAMFDMGYPHLYRPGVVDESLYRDHIAEVYEIDDDVYDAIEHMEIGAGYVPTPVNVAGVECTMFYTRDDYGYKDNWVESYGNAQ